MCMARSFRIAVVAAAVVGSMSIPTAAQAAHKASTTATPLTMTSQTTQWNPNLPGVTCLTEDDYDERDFSGSLAGSYSTDYRLCDYKADGYTAGGIGLHSYISVVGQLSDLTVTAPDGTVRHAVPAGQSTYKGVTSYSYSVCYTPLYYTATNTGTDPLPGGNWRVTVSGQLSKVSWVTYALMTDANYQQTNCPASQQNLA